MDEYLVVLCGIMLFGGQLDSDRLVSSFVSMVCKLSGTQLYVGECVCVWGGGVLCVFGPRLAAVGSASGMQLRQAGRWLAVEAGK